MCLDKLLSPTSLLLACFPQQISLPERDFARSDEKKTLRDEKILLVSLKKYLPTSKEVPNRSQGLDPEVGAAQCL